MDTRKKIIFGIGFNIFTSIVFLVLSWGWDLLPLKVAITGAVIVIGLDIFIIVRKSFKKIGIAGWSEKRGSSTEFRECLNGATTTVDFLVSWGGSLPGLSSYWQQEISDMVNRGIKFRFLVLKPKSYGEYVRRRNGAKWSQMDHKSTLETLMLIKKERIEAGHWNDFKVALYETEACWSMAFVDNKFASIGFYGTGVGRDHPSLQLERVRNESLFDAFYSKYEVLWKEAFEKNAIHVYEDLAKVYSEAEKRADENMVIALMGPCGAGKTTLAKMIEEKLTCATRIKTYTTRPQRTSVEVEQQYYFVNDEEYSQMDSKNQFVAKGKYCNYQYAISEADVARLFEAKQDIIMDTIIDPAELKQCFGSRLISFYLTASSNQTMVERSKNRFGEKKEHLRLRVENTKLQPPIASLCDFVLFTDSSPEETADTICKIVNETKEAYVVSGRMSPDASISNMYLSRNILEEPGIPRDIVTI